MNANPMANASTTWECIKCTLRNPGRRRRCEVCSSHRPVINSKLEDNESNLTPKEYRQKNTNSIDPKNRESTASETMGETVPTSPKRKKAKKGKKNIVETWLRQRKRRRTGHTEMSQDHPKIDPTIETNQVAVHVLLGRRQSPRRKHCNIENDFSDTLTASLPGGYFTTQWESKQTTNFNTNETYISDTADCFRDINTHQVETTEDLTPTRLYLPVAGPERCRGNVSASIGERESEKSISDEVKGFSNDASAIADSLCGRTCKIEAKHTLRGDAEVSLSKSSPFAGPITTTHGDRLDSHDLPHLSTTSNPDSPSQPVTPSIAQHKEEGTNDPEYRMLSPPNISKRGGTWKNTNSPSRLESESDSEQLSLSCDESQAQQSVVGCIGVDDTIAVCNVRDEGNQSSTPKLTTDPIEPIGLKRNAKDALSNAQSDDMYPMRPSPEAVDHENYMGSGSRAEDDQDGFMFLNSSIMNLSQLRKPMANGLCEKISVEADSQAIHRELLHPKMFDKAYETAQSEDLDRGGGISLHSQSERKSLPLEGSSLLESEMPSTVDQCENGDGLLDVPSSVESKLVEAHIFTPGAKESISATEKSMGRADLIASSRSYGLKEKKPYSIASSVPNQSGSLQPIFSTAGNGTLVSVSESSIDKATALLESAAKEEKDCPKTLLRQTNRHQCKPPGLLTANFATAGKGNRICVTQASMEKANVILKSKMDFYKAGDKFNAESLTSTQVGTTVPFPDSRAAADGRQKRLATNDDIEKARQTGEMPLQATFSTAGTGNRIVVAEADVEKANYILEMRSKEHQKHSENIPAMRSIPVRHADLLSASFSTAGKGRMVAITDEGIAKANKILETNKKEDRKKLVISRSPPINLDKSGSLPAGFSTAGQGQMLNVTEASMEKARRIMTWTQDDNKRKFPCSRQDGVDRAKNGLDRNDAGTEFSSSGSRNHCNLLKTAPNVVFSTAGKGEMISVSESSLFKTTKLFEMNSLDGTKEKYGPVAFCSEKQTESTEWSSYACRQVAGLEPGVSLANPVPSASTREGHGDLQSSKLNDTSLTFPIETVEQTCGLLISKPQSLECTKEQSEKPGACSRDSSIISSSRAHEGVTVLNEKLPRFEESKNDVASTTTVPLFSAAGSGKIVSVSESSMAMASKLLLSVSSGTDQLYGEGLSIPTATTKVDKPLTINRHLNRDNADAAAIHCGHPGNKILDPTISSPSNAQPRKIYDESSIPGISNSGYGKNSKGNESSKNNQGRFQPQNTFKETIDTANVACQRSGNFEVHQLTPEQQTFQYTPPTQPSQTLSQEVRAPTPPPLAESLSTCDLSPPRQQRQFASLEPGVIANAQWREALLEDSADLSAVGNVLIKRNSSLLTVTDKEDITGSHLVFENQPDKNSGKTGQPVSASFSNPSVSPTGFDQYIPKVSSGGCITTTTSVAGVENQNSKIADSDGMNPASFQTAGTRDMISVSESSIIDATRLLEKGSMDGKESICQDASNQLLTSGLQVEPSDVSATPLPTIAGASNWPIRETPIFPVSTPHNQLVRWGSIRRITYGFDSPVDPNDCPIVQGTTISGCLTPAVPVQAVPFGSTPAGTAPREKSAEITMSIEGSNTCQSKASRMACDLSITPVPIRFQDDANRTNFSSGVHGTYPEIEVQRSNHAKDSSVSMFKDAWKSGRMTDFLDKCQRDGVLHVTQQVDSTNAVHVRFTMAGGRPIDFDGKNEIPECQTVGGTSDLRVALEARGCNSHLLNDSWIANHKRWIVWKLASYERRFSIFLGGGCLRYDTLLSQLRKRFFREIKEGQRPALRKILNRDAPSTRMMILCVAQVFTRHSQASNAGDSPPATFSLELTDGWYSVGATLDAKLSEFVGNGLVRVGTKLMICGARLTGADDGIDPLDPEYRVVRDSNVQLHLMVNSTRLAKWNARLGYIRMSPAQMRVHKGMFCFRRISDVIPGGGNIPFIRVRVTKLYPRVFLEKCDDQHAGSTLPTARYPFLTEAEEEMRRLEFERRKLKAVEKVIDSITAEVEKVCSEIQDETVHLDFQKLSSWSHASHYFLPGFG